MHPWTVWPFPSRTTSLAVISMQIVVYASSVVKFVASTSEASSYRPGESMVVQLSISVRLWLAPSAVRTAGPTATTEATTTSARRTDRGADGTMIRRYLDG